MPRSISAREANSQRIKDALLQACGDLLAENPIDAITINNIVEAAGVAKGSFYNHFPDKETLASAVATEIRSEVERAVEASNINVTDPAYKVVRGICNHLQLAWSDPRRATIMLRGHETNSTAESPLNLNIRAHLQEGLCSGRFAPRCEEVGIIQLIGTTYVSMFRIIEQQYTLEQAIDFASRICTLMLCGFGVGEEEATMISRDSARDLIRA